MRLIKSIFVGVVALISTLVYGRSLQFSPDTRPLEMLVYVNSDCDFTCRPSRIFPKTNSAIVIRCYLKNLNRPKRLKFTIYKDDPLESAIEILQVGSLSGEVFPVGDIAHVDVKLIARQRKEMHLTFAFSTDNGTGNYENIHAVGVSLFEEHNPCELNVEENPNAAGFRRLFGLAIPAYLRKAEDDILTGEFGWEMRGYYLKLGIPLP